MRRQAIFDCCKWDPQVEDVATLAPFPLLLPHAVWRDLAALAEALGRETLEAEAELLERPELHRELALPRPLRKALLAARGGRAARGAARVLRFDFHWTAEGWRISEVNSDVPGGFNEASGFSRLMAGHYPGTRPTGDPAGRLADAVAQSTAPGETVALVHATAYSDDRQVMVYLARELEARGRRAVLTGPDHLRWDGERVAIASAAFSGPAAFLLRFFPAEWLSNLPKACGWERFAAGSEVPVSNPASALLTQSKRLPLVWDRLAAPLPTWRRLLPETHDPREVPWRREEGWVVKPALGRVGDGVGVAGATGAKEWRAIRSGVRWAPRHWVAQRRFDAVPLETPEGKAYPCLGVYTVDGEAAGIYGRASPRPRIDHLARDLAVLIVQETSHDRT